MKCRPRCGNSRDVSALLALRPLGPCVLPHGLSPTAATVCSVLRLLLVALLVIVLFGWALPPFSVAARQRLRRWTWRAGVAVVLVVLVRAGFLFPAAFGAVLLFALRMALPWLGRALPGVGAARSHGFSSANSQNAPTMSRSRALEVLNLTENATREQIMSTYRELMKRVHPDRGGSSYLAAEVNQAKDVLLG